MRFYLISDNVDTQVGCALQGLTELSFMSPQRLKKPWIEQ